MIEKADKHLRDWIQKVLPETEVALSFDGGNEDRPHVVLLLLDIHRATPAQSVRMPLKINLRYLISLAGGAMEKRHQLLGELVFAALEEASFETQLEPPPNSLWLSLGVHPRPAFYCVFPLTLERPTVAKTVREVVVRHAPTTHLRGQLIDHNHRPVAGASIQISGLSTQIHSDRNGKFEFKMIPRQPERKQVLIHIGSREIVQNIVIPDNDETQITVPINLKEM